VTSRRAEARGQTEEEAVAVAHYAVLEEVALVLLAKTLFHHI